jgi:hypothetical protein
LCTCRKKIELRRRRTNDEDLFGIFERRSHVVKVPLVACVAALLFGVALHMMVRRFDLGHVEPFGRDVEDLRFLVIDPDGSVTDGHGNTSEASGAIPWGRPLPGSCRPERGPARAITRRPTAPRVA